MAKGVEWLSLVVAPSAVWAEPFEHGAAEVVGRLVALNQVSETGLDVCGDVAELVLAAFQVIDASFGFRFLFASASLTQQLFLLVWQVFTDHLGLSCPAVAAHRAHVHQNIRCLTWNPVDVRGCLGGTGAQVDIALGLIGGAFARDCCETQ